jgi:hypothetical protein
MRWVVANREEAAVIGERGRRDVRQIFDPDRAVAAIRERVAALS